MFQSIYSLREVLASSWKLNTAFTESSVLHGDGKWNKRVFLKAQKASQQDNIHIFSTRGNGAYFSENALPRCLHARAVGTALRLDGSKSAGKYRILIHDRASEQVNFCSLRVPRDIVLEIFKHCFLQKPYSHFTQPVILIQLSCCCYHAITNEDYGG